MTIIKTYCGPMFSGKTTALINEYNKNNKISIIIRPIYDTRSNELFSRNGLMAPSFQVKSIDDIEKIIKNNVNKKIFLFDEMQFFDSNNFNGDIINLILKMKQNGISSYLYGLDYNWKGELFEISKKIIAISDEVCYLNANCNCGKLANRTMKKEVSTSIFDIGDSLYTPSCMSCFKIPEVKENK